MIIYQIRFNQFGPYPDNVKMSANMAHLCLQIKQTPRGIYYIRMEQCGASLLHMDLSMFKYLNMLKNTKKNITIDDIWLCQTFTITRFFTSAWQMILKKSWELVLVDKSTFFRLKRVKHKACVFIISTRSLDLNIALAHECLKTHSIKWLFILS